MEGNLRLSLITAVAPIAWGTTYFVTQHFLPADQPLYGAVVRALPAGLLLLLISRRAPTGSWWWKSLVLGTLNVGAFFVLIYISAQLLPSSVAATVMAIAPVVMMVLAWVLLSERPRPAPLIGAVLGIAGVALMVLTSATGIDTRGVLASFTAMVMSSLGYILAKRWDRGGDLTASTSWQLTAGGLVLLPVAVVVEGAPADLTLTSLLGFGYLSVIATAIAFVAWFTGLRHLNAGTVGLIGLLNPVTGVVVGVLFAAEMLSGRQLIGLVLVLAGVALGQPLLARRRERTAVRISPSSVDAVDDSTQDGVDDSRDTAVR